MSDEDVRRNWDDEEEPFEEEENLSEEELRLPSEEELLSSLERLEQGEAGTSELEEQRRFKPSREIEVKVVGVFEHAEPTSPPHTFVMLRDNKGRQVPILIGRFEALSISLAFNGETTERPLTHDLLKNILDRLKIGVDRVVIDDLWHDTFYAKIFLTENGEEIEIDSRPSDAIALALRSRAPIYMSESVVETVMLAQEEE